jgi:hypothetical protein
MSETHSRSTWKLWVGILVGALVTLAVLAALAIYAVGCAIGKVGQALQTDTKVAVQAVTTNGQLELNLTYGNEATGISMITFTDAAGNKLWEVTGQGSEKPAKLIYGQLPADGSLKQTFPEDGKPPPDIRGQTVTIEVDNRYQVAFGPGHEMTKVTVTVPK